MKKLLTLVLCWLLAFSAMAETTFKAKTAASVAGGYVTSLNKVDGSFEDGTSQWVASADNIVKTASTEMQGNNIGVWTGTGTQTLDLQWTATASNTYEATAQVDVQGEDDVYVCAYVGTTETGCKLIPALSKIQKVSVVADSVISSAFYLRLKHTGSDAFSIKVDDGKIEPFTPQAVNLLREEAITTTGYMSRDGSDRVLFKTLETNNSGTVITSSHSESASYTKITFLQKSKFKASASLDQLAAGGRSSYVQLKTSANVLRYSSRNATSVNTLAQPLALDGEANAGDYLIVVHDGVLSDSTSTNFSITASAISENVVQSYAPSDFLGEIKLLPSTTAPKGFIPADGKSIGKTSGNYQGDAYYALYALRWAMASTTAGEPYVISSAKGASAQADWDAGKTITIDVRGMFFRAAGGNAGTVGSKQSDAFQGHQHTSNAIRLGASIASSTGYDYNGSQTTSSIVTDGINGTPRTASETRPVNTSEYAYMRYGTSAPDLIALPTSKINDYSGFVSSAGVISDVTPYAAVTASKGGTGLYTINYSALGLTSTPKPDIISLSSTYNWVVTSISSTSMTVQFANTAGTVADSPFFFGLRKSNSDYTAPGVFVGNVAKNQVAYVKDVKVSGANGGPTTANTWMQRDLNTVEGDAGVVSVDANTFTLQVGEYEIDAEAPVYTGGYHRLGLALSTSSTPNVAVGSTEWSGSAGSYATTKSRLVTRLSVGAPTTYKFLHRTSVSVASSGLGTGSNFGIPEVYTQVKITKLNGN